MINRLLFFILSIVVIFIEVYFFKTLISFINLSFVVIGYSLIKKRNIDIVDFGFMFFFLKDFFSLNFVGPSLLVFVIGSYILSLFQKVAGEYYLGILNIFLILILNAFFYDGFINITTFSNFLLISIFVAISIVKNSGYFRSN